MNKSRALRITLYALLIFLAGGITGALVAPRFGRTFMRPPDSKQMSQHMMERLQSGLNLTRDQATKIKPLVEKTAADMDTMRRETSKRVHDRVAETNAQISLLLTPAQKEKFIQMEVEHRKRISRCHPCDSGSGEMAPP
ncbi:MAG: YtxH domain-containing protein [Chthoniobacterales bacterium]